MRIFVAPAGIVLLSVLCCSLFKRDQIYIKVLVNKRGNFYHAKHEMEER